MEKGSSATLGSFVGLAPEGEVLVQGVNCLGRYFQISIPGCGFVEHFFFTFAGIGDGENHPEAMECVYLKG